MLDDFREHINSNFSFLSNHNLLLAVSGGLDSMVLAHLCLRSNFNISVAHCNFSLRGSESDADLNFVQEFCKEHGLTFYDQVFNTKEIAQSNGLSTQMAARDLRYTWFEELLVSNELDYLLTAHHLNDDLETFLINFGRGTGLAGLTGIPSVNGKIVRPLLKFSRKRIKDYAIQTNIEWREDESNASDDYIRNHLRHHAIPALEQAYSNLYAGFEKTQAHLVETEKLLAVYDEQLREKFSYPIDSIHGIAGLGIDCDLLNKHSEPDAVLYRLLRRFGFTAWEDIYALRIAQTGKQIASKTHRLLKNRNALEVYPLKDEVSESFMINENITEFSGPFGVLKIDYPSDMTINGSQSIVVPSKLLDFPLVLRKWEHGDYFYPFGLGGKKKLSKYFKDEKLSLVEKENIWVLCNNHEIVWVINHRADDRYKVTDATQKMTRFTLVYETKNS